MEKERKWDKIAMLSRREWPRLLRQLKLTELIRPCQATLGFGRVLECKKEIIPEAERKRKVSPMRVIQTRKCSRRNAEAVTEGNSAALRKCS